MSKDLDSQKVDPKDTSEQAKTLEESKAKKPVLIKAESEVARREEEVLDYWRKQKIFEKSLQKPAPEGEFVFYDGPPFATGLPHYGHLLAGTIKDVIPRFQTMRGKYVRRVWGWDVHGLPVENLIEKKLGVNTKREIEELGIDTFNEEARGSVLKYRDEWREIIPRTGRFVDMENDYKTMNPEYSETTWWIFKSLFDKELVYEGFKSMHLCPRCGTTLSNFEVNQGYKDIKDLSVTAKFELTEEPDTFLLAWTTTPWTLPGNMAIGVHADIDYVKVAHDNARYILAKDTLERVFKDAAPEVVEEMKGSDLAGLSYKPPFPYFLEKEFEHKENAWKVYTADYVTTDDGTGIVHLAPAFGEEDLLLAQEKDIPVVHHVNYDGMFTEDVTDFAGEKVKPKDEEGEEHMAIDIEIIKWLAHNGKLFSKEKITHSYPHCWRCDTPLLNYATTSWFIAVTKIKDKILAANEEVHWTPERVGSGRFGKWLENARDWAVSRSRYWGSPLPVWRSDETGEMEVIGSLRELREKSRDALTEVVVMRHAESEKNTQNLFDASLDGYDLTEVGVTQARTAAQELKGKIDVIYTSPVLRARRTAEIIGKELGIDVEVSEEVREVGSGDWEGKVVDDPSIQEAREKYLNLPVEERYRTKRGVTGESWEDVGTRVEKFLGDVINKHAGKAVLIVGHQGVVAHVERVVQDAAVNDELFERQSNGDFAQPFNFVLRSDSGKRFDFHRPYIDEIKVYSERGTELTRVPEVFDTWYESGSMPYGQHHYPFENNDIFDPKEEKGFPADFIAEGLDQTRGWFYSLIVLGVGLFDRSPYKNVIVNGIVLAEDGQKMSKRLMNYPDPLEVISKYGADALRLYLLSSSVVRAEDLSFSEKGVGEVMRKVVGRLDNVLKFYELYREESLEKEVAKVDTENVLDLWITARLSETERIVRESLESYELDRATRPLFDFVDDLSTWYLRRSRDRFKGAEDEQDAQAVRRTLYATLKSFAQIAAPFMPFYADHLYRILREENEPESVHLANWPTFGNVDTSMLDSMERVRSVVSEGLEVRAREGIKVRQPLASLSYGGKRLSEELELIIADEMNVKSVNHEEGLESVEIDTTITNELRIEGTARELVRAIQNKRKNEGLNPHDRVTVSVEVQGGEVEVALKDHYDYIIESINAERIDLNTATTAEEEELQKVADSKVAITLERI